MHDYLKSLGRDGIPNPEEYLEYVQKSIEANKKLSLSQRAANASTKLLSVGLNMLTSIGVELFLTAVVKGLDAYIHRAENAKKASDALFDEFENAQQNLSSHKELIEKVDENYERLSSGVDGLGRNLSLSNEDFEEYQGICNEIAAAYPKLVDAWDKEGNAVIDLRDKVNDLRDAYEKERKAALNSFVTDADKVMKNYNLNADHSASWGLDSYGYKQQIEALNILLNLSKQAQDVNGLFRLYQNLPIKDGIPSLSAALQSLPNDINKYKIDEIPDIVSGTIKELQSKLSEADDEVKQTMLNMFALDTFDKEISDQAYQLGTSFIDSLDNSVFGGKNDAQLRSFVDNIIDQLTGDNSLNTENVINKLIGLEDAKKDLSTSAFKQYLDGIISDLQRYLGLEKNQARIMVGLEKDESVNDHVNRLVESVNKKTRDAWRSSLQFSNFDAALGELPFGYLEELNNLSDKYYNNLRDKFVYDDDINTTKEYIAALEKYIDDLHKVEETTEKVSPFAFLTDEDTSKKLSSFTSAMETIKSQLKALSDYQLSPDDTDFTDFTNSILESMKSLQEASTELGVKFDWKYFNPFNSDGTVDVESYGNGLVFANIQMQGTIDKLVEIGKITPEVAAAYKKMAEEMFGVTALQEQLSEVISKTDGNYEHYLAAYEKVGDDIDNQISHIESMGGKVNSSAYEARIDNSKEQIKILEEQIKLYESLRDSEDTVAGSSQWYEYIDNISSAEDKIASLNSRIDDSISKMRELDLAVFDEKKNIYGDAIDIFTNRIENLENEVSKIEDADGKVGDALYQALADETNGMIEMYRREKEDLLSELNQNVNKGYIDYLSPEWYEMYNEILAADEAINDLNDTLDEYIKKAKEARIAIFDEIAETYDARMQAFDYITESLQSQIDATESSGSVVGTHYYSSMIDTMKQETQALQRERTDLIAQLNDLVNNGDVEYMSDEWREMYYVIQDVEQKISDTNSEIIDMSNSLKELHLNLFNDIATAYSNIDDVYGNRIDRIQSEIDYLEAKGETVSEEYYEALAKEASSRVANLEAQKRDLQVTLDDLVSRGFIQYKDDDWWEMYKEIQDIDSAILDARKSVVEFNKSIEEINTSLFDTLIDRLSAIKSEISSIISMMDDSDMAEYVNGESVFTKEGLTTLALYIEEMERSKYAISEYKKAENDLRDAYNAGTYTLEEYTEKMYALREAQFDEIASYQDAVNNIKELNEARVDAVEDGMAKELEAYEKIIQAKKDSLDAEKDLYEFEKSVREKQQNVSNLNRQIAALSGDTSLSGRSQLAKLMSERDDAQADLDDYLYTNSIDKQQQALDNELDAYKSHQEEILESLRQTLENTDQLISTSIELVLGNTALVSNQLKALEDQFGINFSDTITETFTHGNNSLASFGEQLNSQNSAFIRNLENLKQHIYSVDEQADVAAQAILNMINQDTNPLVQGVGNIRQSLIDEMNQANLTADSIINMVNIPLTPLLNNIGNVRQELINEIK